MKTNLDKVVLIWDVRELTPLLCMIQWRCLGLCWTVALISLTEVLNI